jgi:hypothetical protein
MLIATKHIWHLANLSKIGGCVLPTTFNLVQRQKGKGKEWRVRHINTLPTHPPEIDRLIHPPGIPFLVPLS